MQVLQNRAAEEQPFGRAVAGHKGHVVCHRLPWVPEMHGIARQGDRSAERYRPEQRQQQVALALPVQAADPQQFANTYVASLHLPFPLFFAYAAGFSELIGSWLVILGLLTPVGALALSGTMTVAAYQHISTAGFNIYVLELVVLYLGGSLALLFNGPGRFSFDAGIVPAVLDDLSATNDLEPAFSSLDAGELRAIPVTVNANARG